MACHVLLYLIGGGLCLGYTENLAFVGCALPQMFMYPG